jgi:hypothetical protein
VDGTFGDEGMDSISGGGGTGLLDAGEENFGDTDCCSLGLGPVPEWLLSQMYDLVFLLNVNNNNNNNNK